MAKGGRGPIDATQVLRDDLVSQLRKAGAIKTGAVARAFRKVPRHLFVPEHPPHAVYDDRALITKTRAGDAVSSSSQPAIMAIMLEQLRLRAGMSVLEVGAGTGYNAALLAEIVGPRGRVVSIDIQPDVAAAARSRVASLGQENVRIVTGDGARGYARGAPFDRIIVTASCWHVPSAWLHQLAENGVLVLPLRLNGSHVSLALRRHGDSLRTISARQCGFMAMQGIGGRPMSRRLTSGASPLVVQGDARINLSRLRALLRTTPRRVEVEALKEIANPGDAFSFATFQALQGHPLVGIGPRGGPNDSGLCDSRGTSLCLTGFTPVMRGRLAVYGSDSMRDAFEESLRAWIESGKPATNRLRVRVREGSGDALDELPRRVGRGRYAWARGDMRFDARYV